MGVYMLCLSSCLSKLTGTGMTGGISHLDLKDSENMEVIRKGIGIFLERLQKQDASHVLYRPICVQASSQVVQGVLYRVAMEIVPEDSAYSRAIDFDCIPEADSSPLAKKDKRFACFSIWSREWLPFHESFIVEEQNQFTDAQSCLYGKQPTK